MHADDHLTLHADSHVKVGKQWLGKAGEEIHIETGQRMVLKAGSELTVKAGGSWLKVDAGGVHMGGTTINIAGGGAAGQGSSAMPIRPAGWIGFSFNKHGTYKGLECLAHFSDGSKRKGIFDENNMVYFSGLGKEVKCEKLEILAPEVSPCSSIVEKLLS